MFSRRRQRCGTVGRHNHHPQPAQSKAQGINTDQSQTPSVADVFLCSDPMVLQAIRFIASNITRDLMIEDLATHLETSRETLIRRFKETLGRSVMSEVRRQRVDHLKRRLTETDRPIAEISDACGFSSPGQFSRYFKREVGITPSAYRKGRIVPERVTSYRQDIVPAAVAV